jgi:hypothetical protein
VSGMRIRPMTGKEKELEGSPQAAYYIEDNEGCLFWLSEQDVKDMRASLDALGVGPAKAEPKPGTVRVRIAVAANAHGHWSAHGSSSRTEKAVTRCVVGDVAGGPVVAWVEADVPLPSAPVVQGEVSEPEARAEVERLREEVVYWRAKAQERVNKVLEGSDGD